MIKVEPKSNCHSPINYSFKGRIRQNDAASSFESGKSESLWEIPSDRFNGLKTYYLMTGENEKIIREMNPKLFFIRMAEYGCDHYWALNMSKVALNVSKAIKNKEDFDVISNYICDMLFKLNYSEFYGKKRQMCITGMNLRKGRRGEEYIRKYEKMLSKNNGVIKPKANSEYKDALTATISKYSKDIFIEYGHSCDFIDGEVNLDLCEKAYNKLILNENPTEKDVIDTCATIQWLISQACPFWKGNDSYANLLTKAIMHSYGIELSPIKEGHSLDFEAFYRDLDDYIKKYPTFFEKYPKYKE